MAVEVKGFLAVNENTDVCTVDGSLLVTSGSDFPGLLIPCTIATTITEIVIADGGTGYEVGDIVTIVQDDNTTATAVVTSVDEDGVITGISIVDGGSDYTEEEDLAVTGGSGTGATVDITEVTSITQITAGAVINTSQGIRLVITVAGEDVTASLIGNIQITHNLNYISSFSFSLGNPDHSPLVDTNIDIDSVVIITAYVNGVEMKLFTGLVDKTESRNSDSGYILTIQGRDYGKKLLNTTKTLISVQEAASSHRRGNIVKFLAQQAGITSTNIPTGDLVTIDHSFQDQTIWDMIQKECAIEGWYVRFDEEAKMICKTRDTDATAHWTYGENKFTEIGLQAIDEGIINKVTILGAIFENTELQQTSDSDDYVTPSIGSISGDDFSGSGGFDDFYSYSTVSTTNSYNAGESVNGWSGNGITVSVVFAGYSGSNYAKYRFTASYPVTSNIVSYTWSSDAYISSGAYSQSCTINRNISGTPEAFSVTVTIKTRTSQFDQIADDNPNETFTENVTNEQVKADVIDYNSIAKYGERKPNNEGTLNYPLAETTAQCQRIGENIILDSHRFIKQPDLMVMFNPKLIVGQRVNLTDKKIGYDDDDYFVEEVVHYINIDKDGKVKGRTRIGCVYYA